MCRQSSRQEKRCAVVLFTTFAMAVSAPAWGWKWPWEPSPELASAADFINSRAPYWADGIGAAGPLGRVSVLGAEAKGKLLRLRLRLEVPIHPDHHDTVYLIAAGEANMLCNEAHMLEMFLKGEYMILSYSDVNGAFVTEVVVDKKRCGYGR